MRKFVTVMLIFVMLSMPARFAAASGGDGGGIVILNAISAYSKPTLFTTVLLVNYVFVSTFFAPLINQLPPRIRARATLTLTASYTLAYFQRMMIEFAMYFLYTVTLPLFFSPQSPASKTTATPEEAQTGLWSASNPDVMTNVEAKDEEKEKQDLINRAVQGALRDPEVAQRYLDYATPEVQAAVTKALANQAAGRSGN